MQWAKEEDFEFYSVNLKEGRGIKEVIEKIVGDLEFGVIEEEEVKRDSQAKGLLIMMIMPITFVPLIIYGVVRGFY